MTIAAVLALASDKVDKVVTTEAESEAAHEGIKENHREDLQMLLNIIETQQRQLIETVEEAKKERRGDSIARYQREIDRLERDLAGRKYNNEDERDTILRDIRRNEGAIECLRRGAEIEHCSGG